MPSIRAHLEASAVAMLLNNPRMGVSPGFTAEHAEHRVARKLLAHAIEAKRRGMFAYSPDRFRRLVIMATITDGETPTSVQGYVRAAESLPGLDDPFTRLVHGETEGADVPMVSVGDVVHIQGRTQLHIVSSVNFARKFPSVDVHCRKLGNRPSGYARWYPRDVEADCPDCIHAAGGVA